jgi:hypothetical protein
LAGFNLIATLRDGVLEQLRVTPISMVIRDVLTLLVQSVLLLLLSPVVLSLIEVNALH